MVVLSRGNIWSYLAHVKWFSKLSYLVRGLGFDGGPHLLRHRCEAFSTCCRGRHVEVSDGDGKVDWIIRYLYINAVDASPLHHSGSNTSFSEGSIRIFKSLVAVVLCRSGRMELDASISLDSLVSVGKLESCSGRTTWQENNEDACPAAGIRHEEIMRMLGQQVLKGNKHSNRMIPHPYNRIKKKNRS